MATKYIDYKENNTRYRAVTIALEDIVGDSSHFSPLVLIITLFYEDDIPRDLIKVLYAQYDHTADIDVTWTLVESVLIRSGFMNKHPSKSNKLIMHRFTKPIVRSYTFEVLRKLFGGRRDEVFSKVIIPFFAEYQKFLREDVEPSNSNIYLKRKHFAHITSFMDFWQYFKGPQEGLQYFWILQGRLSKEIEGEDIEGRSIPPTPPIVKLGYLDRMSSGNIRIDTPTSASFESLGPAGKLSKDELFIKEAKKHVEEGKGEKAMVMYRRLLKKKGLVPRLKAKVLILRADLYFWGENGIEKNIAKAKKYAHIALEIDTIDEEDRIAAETLLEDDSDTDVVSSTASTHTPVPRKGKSLTASKSLTISKASITSTKDSDELADTPKRSTASSPRLPIATATPLDPGTLKLQEAQSCYESGHYKSALLKYRVVSRMRGIKEEVRAKALVACAEIFFGNYAEVKHDLVQARRYAQEALKISAIEEESKLTAEMILEDTGATKDEPKLKAITKITRVTTVPLTATNTDSTSASKLAQGVSLYNKKKYVQARKILEEVITTIGADGIALGKARRLLGVIYYNGDGIEKDYARARGYFEEVLTTEGAGGFDLGEARRFLGYIYYYGYGIAKDYARARGYYESVLTTTGADGFDLGEARRFLGYIYYYGYGVAQDYARARGYFETVLTTAGANGLSLGEARRFLGNIYYNGYGVAKDYARARGYFEAVLTTEGAGSFGLGVARRFLGEIYYFENGVAKNYARARGYFEEVLTTTGAGGFELGVACRYLGHIYYSGYGVAQDYARARGYFETVLTTAGADGLSLGEARRFLGQIYYFGYGVAEDNTRARKYFEEVLTTEGAGGVNLGEVRKFLGEIYYFGNGVEKDYARARRYFEAVLATTGAGSFALGTARRFLVSRQLKTNLN